MWRKDEIQRPGSTSARTRNGQRLISAGREKVYRHGAAHVGSRIVMDLFLSPGIKLFLRCGFAVFLSPAWGSVVMTSQRKIRGRTRQLAKERNKERCALSPIELIHRWINLMKLA